MIKRDQFGRRVAPAAPEPTDSTPDRTAGGQTPAPAESPSAPKAGDRSPDAARGAGKHHFEVSNESEGSKPTGSAAKLFKFLGLCLVLAGLVQIGWYATHRPDSHYLRAEKLVNDYEIGRPKQVRNYGHTIYRQALDELELVDSGSVSANSAVALQSRIERDVLEFSQRREVEQTTRSAAAEKKARREAAVVAARQWSKEHSLAEEDYDSHGKQLGED
jgi:hypothetical protein